MKKYFTLLFILSSCAAWAQQDTAVAPVKRVQHSSMVRHSVIASVSVGFVDYYKNNYSLPSGFEKSNTSGFAPVYARLEYGLSRHVAIAAIFGYDAFFYNYKQVYTGNNGQFTRYLVNNTRIFNAGVAAFYHFGDIVPIKQIDPYVGVGIALSNIRYSAYPQGDSTAVNKDHISTVYLKAGARYYISDVFSVMADVGYDKQSIFDIGFSCRFFSKKYGVNDR